MPMTGRYFVYVGTYTAKGSEGIYVCRFDASSGGIEGPVPAASLPNPTFQALHPNGQVLYSGSEVRDASGRHGGSVNAFAIDPASGALRLLNRQSSGGAGPCHLSVSPDGRYLAVANYASGSVGLLSLEAEGRLGELAELVQHRGSSVNPERQEAPHAHSANFSPDGRFLFVADLGIDRVMAYRLDAAQGRLVAHDPPWVASRPGSGPRHLAFHPSRRWAYVIHELDNTITAFAYDEPAGLLRETQILSALPAGFSGTSFAADVHVSPSGRSLYGSNRGHDSIAVFRIEASTGRLAPVGHAPTRGKYPRNFTIAPGGRFLLAANQDSDSVVVFHVDGDTGWLSATGQTAAVSMPVCLTSAPCRR